MNEKLRNIKIVVVGFRVKEENSVFYKKLDNPSDRELGCCINVAFHTKNCDFVSVRAIEKKEEKAKP